VSHATSAGAGCVTMTRMRTLVVGWASAAMASCVATRQRGGAAAVPVRLTAVYRRPGTAGGRALGDWQLTVLQEAQAVAPAQR
jgi:hypothetical protein